jgi:hypothetical protein
MKKFATFAALALVASTSAMAGNITDPAPGSTNRDVCTGATAAKYDVANGPGSPYTTAGSFLKTGFAVQCSSNTFVTFQNRSGTLFTVGSSSAKGNQSYKGSSNGGAVVLHLACGQSTTPCAQSDAQTAATAASSM